MKKLCKNQNGAISAFVMLAMIFFLVTIVGVYMVSSKRAQTQTESLEMVQNKYYTEGEENEKYDAKIAKSTDKIPIYTKEQLWSIGTNKAIEIEGKVYDFSNTNFSQYELKNDIVINIDELGNHETNEPTGIQKNNFEIYYYDNGNYYVPASDGIVDLSKNGHDFQYKNFYVKDGLILNYDGINNTGIGHSDSATTWKDLSGNGNDGILCSYHTFGENCLNCEKVVGAYSYSKNIVFAENPQNYTIEVVAEHNSDTDGWLWSLRDKTSTLALQMINYSSKQQFDLWGKPPKSISFTPQINKKFSRSIVSSNDIIKGYDNNQYVGEVNSTSELFINQLPLEFGGTNWNSNISLDGKLYSIRIYNRALTDEEISQNYEVDKARFGIE